MPKVSVEGKRKRMPRKPALNFDLECFKFQSSIQSLPSTTEQKSEKSVQRQNGLVLETPQKKEPSQRKRKFMPKVFVEGKHIRKPRKPASQETRSGKRKKAQINLKGSATDKPAIGGDLTNTSLDVTHKSCRKALSFDSESEIKAAVESVSTTLNGTAARTCPRSSLAEYGSLPQGFHPGNERISSQERSNAESFDVCNLSQNSSLPTPDKVKHVKARGSKRAMGQMQNSVQQRQNITCVKGAKKMKIQKAVQENLHGQAHASEIQTRSKAKENGLKSKQCSGQASGPSGDESREQEQNALVLYRGDGAVVPYEIKGKPKPKPKTKVHLDDETTRVWNLLMGKGEKNGDEDMNKRKEKWWEEERNVFRGRVDSFNARMHLVQGDRRFSPWKGSVVDSVVGVFLTQNVTDHLSSSAFMSLAARYPPKSSSNQEDERNIRSVVVEDPEGSILNFLPTNPTLIREKKAILAAWKKPTSQWDSLRREVLENEGKKERSKDSMDSIDYEAIRRASVHEISDAIIERGMNDMLAVRIKDFLERIVKDHGAVDLEWLRDVHPDKAKDYLLSIRGLGLKSVECVRLLTLHNLAFPVDTNVGRIAVRLGWVPLQPLPESLQLHLLELYPVLESIQKFLWPRLCKLDQPTLYELHYQLISFGKVFCTKSNPNCNACPMRGECRHFASAYASARLALPAPEERILTNATIPVPSESFPPAAIPMVELPPPLEESFLTREAPSNGGSSEPIIEEPATPEQEFTEITESDIEDAYYKEDPDEIPTIELNIRQLGETLEEYMKRNMDLQEGDMSKALVALDPSTTTIPTPKLKNISRLRTEHQVYELTDDHL